MKKLLLLAGVTGSIQMALATTCPNATLIPASPTMPYTVSSIVCGTTNNMTYTTVTNICGSSAYYGGLESVYVWTPTANYSGVTIAYSGQSWSGIMLYAGCPTSGGTCIGNSQGSSTAKTLSVSGTINAGTTYYIVFDTWPSPASPCTGSFTLNGTVTSPATPPTPTQNSTTPTCSGGSILNVTGTPPAGVQWYWQATATGTSTAVPYTGPYTVFANGTYYLRAYSSATLQWSASSSITINNFPLAPAPPAPVANINPSCAPAGSVLTVPLAPAGYTYYWQGTINGTSTASNASTPYNATTSGTYYVSAYETATQCWSNTVGTAVVVNSYIPQAPVAAMNPVNACVNSPSVIVGANPASTSGSTVVTFGTNYTLNPGATTLTGTINIPVGATVISSVLTFNGITTGPSQYLSDMSFNLSGASTYAATYFPGGGATNAGPFNYSTTTNAAGGTVNLNMNNSWFQAATFSTITLTVNYNVPTPTINWYNAAASGTLIGTGSTLQAVGTTVLPNTATAGSYVVYAAAKVGGCTSTTTPITVNITPVLAVLNPVNVTCNGSNNGTFSLGAVGCGSTPFLYSIDGSAYGAIPTNLTPDTHIVTMQDNTGQIGAPISIVITEPTAPTALTVNDVNYFSAEVQWTAQGNETSWIVEYGPAGFTPGTGTTITTSSNPYLIEGLTENTQYQFYVTASCGAPGQAGGPQAFTTNQGFFTFDSSCGPGFTDISATGTALNLTDDASTTVTSGFPLSFQGITSNQITISNNGYISFGGFAVSLYAWNLDLDDEQGNVYYQTLDIAGDNYFVVQWDDRPRYPSVIGQSVTFQLLVNQATNEIYYIYDDVVFGGTQSSNDYGLSGTISAYGPLGTTTVSSYNATYLTNNSCVHFYNALCPNPVNVSTLVFQDDAILYWNPGLYGESNWTIIYGLEGFDPTVPGQAIDTLQLTTSDASFGSTLNQLTSYDVYIYSECQADDLTSPGLLVNFTTLPYCSNPSGITAATDIDSLQAAWSWTASSADYPVTGFNIQYGLSGFPLNSGTILAAGGTNYADTVVNTAFISGGVYEVYIQAVCADLINGGTDTSAFSGPVTFTMPLTNNEACGAEVLAANGTVYTFNNTGATVGTGEAAIAPPATGAQTTTGWTNSTLNNTTWFTFAAPASGSVRINNTTSAYNGQVAVYSAAACADYTTYTLIAANDNAIGGTSLAPNFTICGLIPGNTYHLMHDGFNGTAGVYSTSITPIVLEAGTAHPVTNVCSGDTVNLFTTVSGNAAGGVWSSGIPAVNVSISGSTFTSAGLAPMVFNIEYSVTDGCAYDSVLTQVHVFGPSSAGMDGTIIACLNEPIDLLSGLNGIADLGGSWYSPTGALLPGSQVSASNIPGQFNYDYIAGNGICPNDTANVVVNVTGTCNFLSLDEAIFSGVSVYPNPSQGIVFISSEASEVFDYVITDARGRIVATADNAIKGTQVTEINLNNVETGIYFIRLTNASAEKTFRVVIQ